MCVQGYAWLKECLCNDEGKKQLIKIKDLHLLANRLKIHYLWFETVLYFFAFTVLRYR